MLLILIIACRESNSDEQLSNVNETTPASIAVDTPISYIDSNTPAPILPAQTTITLTVWVAPEFAPSSRESNGDSTTLPTNPKGDDLLAQIQAFDNDNDNINIVVEEKLVSGQGGILSYLRTGREIASSILPDLILIPSNQVAGASDENLIFPLNSLVSSEDEIIQISDLYPAAAQLVQIDEQWLGYPYVIQGLTHLAYNQTIITDTMPPATWASLTNSNANIVFPTAGRNGGDLVMQYYLAQGGSLTNDVQNPLMQADLLIDVLTSFQQARNNGSIAIQSSNVNSFDSAWALFQNGEVSATPVLATSFLKNRATGQEAGFAPLPGAEASLSPYVTGWVWAISTPTPSQQQLAATLIAWLVNESNLGALSINHLLLPATKSAFNQWPTDDPYVAFLQGELERAQIYPPIISNNLRLILGEALYDVLSLNASPTEASEAIFNQFQE